MTALFIGCPVCASLYLGRGWLESNAQLRVSIATLKRQLARRER